MTVSSTCLKCGSNAIRHSEWRRKDGRLRQFFYSAFRCQTCGHRQHRFSLWRPAVAIAVLLFIAFFFGVVHIVSGDYEQTAMPPLLSPQAETR